MNVDTELIKPEDFEWRKTKDGKGVIIDKYKGRDIELNIPSMIMGLPVTEIKQIRNEKLTSVVFPDTITEIGTHMLGFCGAVKSVTIGRNVRVIGTYAFQKNKQLADITIPDSVVKIERGAFEDCGLTRVDIPDSVTFIGKAAFNMNKIKHVTIPKGVTFVSELSFANNALTGVTLQEGLISIENDAFIFNKIADIKIPQSVKSIRESAFEENAIKSLTLPDRLTHLGQRAFRKNKISSLNIGKGLSTIERFAFEDNQISQLTIPPNIKRIGKEAFLNNKIKSVTRSDNTVFLFDGVNADDIWTDGTGPFDKGVEIVKRGNSKGGVYPKVNTPVYPPKPDFLKKLDNDLNRSAAESCCVIKKSSAGREKTPCKEDVIAAFNHYGMDNFLTVKEIEPQGNWKWELEAENDEALAVIIGWNSMEDADRAEEIYKAAPGIMYRRFGSATAYIRTGMESGSVKDALAPFHEAGKGGRK